MTSSEASSPEATSSEAEDHQKLQFIRRCKTQSFKSCSMELNLSKHCKRQGMWSNGHFEGIWRHWMLIFKKRWQSTIVWSVQPLPPLLCSVPATRQENSSEIQFFLQRYSFKMGMDLKWILHRTTTISGKRSLVIDQSFKRLFLMCWQFHNVSFTYLYKGVKT
jgi:hypothetical protein